MLFFALALGYAFTDDLQIVDDGSKFWAISVDGSTEPVATKGLTAICQNGNAVSLAMGNRLFSGANFQQALGDKRSITFPQQIAGLGMSPSGRFLFVTTRASLYYCDRWNRSYQKVEPEGPYREYVIPYGTAAFLSEKEFIVGMGPDLGRARLAGDPDGYRKRLFPGLDGVGRMAAVGVIGYGQGASSEIAFIKDLWVHKSGLVGGAADRISGSGWSTTFTGTHDDWDAKLQLAPGRRSVGAYDRYWATEDYNRVVRIFDASQPSVSIATFKQRSVVGWISRRLLFPN